MANQETNIPQIHTHSASHTYTLKAWNGNREVKSDEHDEREKKIVLEIFKLKT